MINIPMINFLNRIKTVPTSEWVSIVFRGSISLGVVSALVLASMLTWHFYEKDSAFDSARRSALVEAKAAARQIDNDSAKLLIAHAIADDLTANRLVVDDIEARLEQELINHPEVTAF